MEKDTKVSLIVEIKSDLQYPALSGRNRERLLGVLKGERLIENLVGMLIIASFIGHLLYVGLKKMTPAFYRELFFLIVMIVVNIFTGVIAIFAGAMATQTGGNTGALLVILIIEGIPFLLFILSFILLIRKSIRYLKEK